jgi:hypothetical protein
VRFPKQTSLPTRPLDAAQPDVVVIPAFVHGAPQPLHFHRIVILQR